MSDRTVAVSETGRRIGEHNPAAKLTDHEVETMRRYFETTPGRYTQKVRDLAEKFDVNERTVRKIIAYERRACTAARYVDAQPRVVRKSPWR